MRAIWWDAVPFSAATLLGGLEPADRAAMLAVMHLERFAVGETMLLEGGSDERVLVLLAGRVKLETHAASGRRVLLGLRGPGDLRGELRALDGLARGARIGPLDPVTAGVLSSSRFTALVAERPQLALAVLRMLAGRLRESDRRRLELGTADALGRICACLLDLVRLYGTPAGDRIEVTSPLSQEELGTWAGLSRPATARALRQLREDGLLEYRGRRIAIADPAALERRAGR